MVARTLHDESVLAAVPPGATTDRPYVDWAAVIAGAAIAASVSLILVTFGAAVGLSAASPFKGEGIGLTTAAILTALWAVVVQAASFGVGGYFAGRMRRGVGDGSPKESAVRDSAHGLIAWAAAVLLAALLATVAAAGIARKGTDVAALTLGGVAAGVAAGTSATANPGEAVNRADPFGYVADTLFRSDTPRPDDAASSKAETIRILARGAIQGGVAPADRAYLARQVAARTGISQADAEARVNQVLTEAEQAARQAEDKARQAAEAARKATVVLGFLSAAALLIGAAAASAAARAGGAHRTEGTAYRYLFRA